MNDNITTGLYWFRHDLRLTDNSSLNQLCKQVDRLICVYIQGYTKELQSNICEAYVGKSKETFECQSVLALDNALRQKKQYLLVLDTPSHVTLTQLVAKHNVTHIGAERHAGVYEKKSLEMLQLDCPQLKFISETGNTLFSVDDLPFGLEDLPKSFSAFRKKVESLTIDAPIETLLKLPDALQPTPQISPEISQLFTTQGIIEGGEIAAAKQLNTYLFGTDLIRQYKQTRNALDDWDSSSKFSMWLANGCLSVKTVYHSIKQYEAQRGDNESTYWLYFELLWREYFYWYLAKHQEKLFQFCGIQQIAPLTQFNQKTFSRWCEGMTSYPIINACMRQLNKTGYMSNRGRQLVASCFVHELGLDWRYGATYFEQQLIDYDVASNWGNWQYLAGVGADPRGHRRFNLAKQTATYDPQAVFREKWLGSDK